MEKLESLIKSRELDRDKNFEIITNSIKSGGYWNVKNGAGKREVGNWVIRWITELLETKFVGLSECYEIGYVDCLPWVIKNSEIDQTNYCKEVLWISATIFGVLWAILLISPVVGNIPRNKFVFVLT